MIIPLFRELLIQLKQQQFARVLNHKEWRCKSANYSRPTKAPWNYYIVHRDRTANFQLKSPQKRRWNPRVSENGDSPHCWKRVGGYWDCQVLNLKQEGERGEDSEE